MKTCHFTLTKPDEGDLLSWPRVSDVLIALGFDIKISDGDVYEVVPRPVVSTEAGYLAFKADPPQSSPQSNVKTSGPRYTVDPDVLNARLERKSYEGRTYSVHPHSETGREIRKDVAREVFARGVDDLMTDVRAERERALDPSTDLLDLVAFASAEGLI